LNTEIHIDHKFFLKYIDIENQLGFIIK